MSKQIIFNEEARAAMKKGIDKLATAVTMTLGPRGRAVVVEKSYGAPQVTFDGVTVAKEIELEDKYENLGAEFLKQAADKTNDNVGDGTTTSVVLAHALIEEGEKAIREKGFNVIQLAEELKKQSIGIIASLEAQKEEINDVKKIEEVATLSAKDKEIGKLIAEVIETVGREGVVTIDDSNTVGNSHEIVEGMQFDRGYISQYMITNQERMEASLEDPFILVTDKKISSVQEILPVLEKVIGTGRKELVIFADDIDGEALTTLVLNKIRGVFTVLGIKAPGFGDRKKEMLQDIAIVTGGTFVSEEVGKKFDSVEISDLGSARRVVSDKDKTTIVGGKGDKKLISDRIVELKTQLKKIESDYEKEKLEERIGKLASGVAVIKVGAPTESAQKELKQRVEDAVAATRAAMEEGIVPGGGIALLNAALKMKSEKGGSAVSEAAHAILMHAVEAPITAIVLNSGENPSKVLSELKQEKRNEWHGFNAFENSIGDLKSMGIIDPLKVTKTAFTNAISVAANYLTIGAAVVEIPKKEDSHSHGPAGMDY
ncbi:chaperonin GroEL [Candidatus Parcubacteria bacterium]|jgi:chaperonin GroEL|nr:MAG: chaperonin GroEL [Candidatus Parcubacteria bacterium]